MGRLEHRHRVGQVGARSDTDTSHLSRQGVGEVVAVQVERGDDIVFGRTQQNLLQHGVGDDVLDHDVLAGIGVLELHPGPTIEQLSAELVARDFVAPVLEGTLGEFHDVALVDEGD